MNDLSLFPSVNPKKSCNTLVIPSKVSVKIPPKLLKSKLVNIADINEPAPSAINIPGKPKLTSPPNIFKKPPPSEPNIPVKPPSIEPPILPMPLAIPPSIEPPILNIPPPNFPIPFNAPPAMDAAPFNILPAVPNIPPDSFFSAILVSLPFNNPVDTVLDGLPPASVTNFCIFKRIKFISFAIPGKYFDEVISPDVLSTFESVFLLPARYDLPNIRSAIAPEIPDLGNIFLISVFSFPRSPAAARKALIKPLSFLSS